MGRRVAADYVPGFVLPAVRETGDDLNAPVIQPDYETPYGRRAVKTTQRPARR